MAMPNAVSFHKYRTGDKVIGLDAEQFVLLSGAKLDGWLWWYVELS